MTKDKIDIIQTHYGNAIRGNKNNLVKMREVVWVVFFHYNSTGAESQHIVFVARNGAHIKRL